MTWCPHCSKNSHTHHDYTTGRVCCVDCGKVVIHDIYTEDATFVKDSAGGAHLAGNLVKMASDCSESHRRTLEKGYEVIDQLKEPYGIEGVDHATKYYEIAVERGFTRGRRRSLVAAACLYVACREQEKPFLLIEFSSQLSVSVYELGIVYLELCKLLSLQDHPFIQKPVDPSLFMHRYTCLLIKGGGDKKVLNTALHLAVSMKRDWIQTGRKPSGICAAAIYVSCVLHGYNFTRADVVKVVHICEATLTKRLIEFENTKAGSLTIDEFTENARDFEKEMQSCKQSAKELKMPGMNEVVCQHRSNAVQSGFGLCKKCYLEFCGGLDGSEPPAFQRAEMERLSNEAVETSTTSTSGIEPCQKTNNKEKGTQRNDEAKTNAKEIDKGSSTEFQCASPNDPGKIDKISETVNVFESSKDIPYTIGETDTLSDIDDSEVSCFINNEDEIRTKKIMWEHINKEYIQEQAAKEAAAAAAPKNYTGTSKKGTKRLASEAKNVKPAQTAAEAAGQQFAKIRINYDVLNDLFGDDVIPSPKKNRVDVPNAKEQDLSMKHNETNDDESQNHELDFDNGEEINGYGDDYDGYGDDYDGYDNNYDDGETYEEY